VTKPRFWLISSITDQLLITTSSQRLPHLSDDPRLVRNHKSTINLHGIMMIKNNTFFLDFYWRKELSKKCTFLSSLMGLDMPLLFCFFVLLLSSFQLALSLYYTYLTAVITGVVKKQHLQEAADSHPELDRRISWAWLKWVKALLQHLTVCSSLVAGL